MLFPSTWVSLHLVSFSMDNIVYLLCDHHLLDTLLLIDHHEPILCNILGYLTSFTVMLFFLAGADRVGVATLVAFDVLMCCLGPSFIF